MSLLNHHQILIYSQLCCRGSIPVNIIIYTIFCLCNLLIKSLSLTFISTLLAELSIILRILDSFRIYYHKTSSNFLKFLISEHHLLFMVYFYTLLVHIYWFFTSELCEIFDDYNIQYTRFFAFNFNDL
ncbi:hypothetical protein BSPWISOX_2721 [uncultured Gammaproteobacteria bacterium]|nr:hypothetical protein BSPWISOX_2721 [uncultured Gammaproteobacteria bacterium]VVM19895.1 hypothetical protein BSPWISOXPB_8707 [uncultured Gammaproteobacteria bacterium]